MSGVLKRIGILHAWGPYKVSGSFVSRRLERYKSSIADHAEYPLETLRNPCTCNVSASGEGFCVVIADVILNGFQISRSICKFFGNPQQVPRPRAFETPFATSLRRSPMNNKMRNRRRNLILLRVDCCHSSPIRSFGGQVFPVRELGSILTPISRYFRNSMRFLSKPFVDAEPL